MDPDRPAGRADGVSQTAVVVDGVKRMIMTGELAAGSRLPVEKDLATRLGVSRGSLREGVRALAVIGVVETRQGDGTYVTALDPVMLMGSLGFLVDLQQPGDVADLHIVRRILEVEAAGRAALRVTATELDSITETLTAIDERAGHPDAVDHEAVMEADIRFHRLIAGASGNRTLAALIDALGSRTVRTRLWRAINEDGALARTHAEHRAILIALADGDPDTARLRMAVHLLGVEQYLAGSPDRPVPAGGPDQEALADQ